jgi:hypothetical protein
MTDGPCGTWKIRDIPADQVENVIGDCRVDNPKSVTKEDQGNGLWTVIVVFEDCPPGQPNVTETSHSNR